MDGTSITQLVELVGQFGFSVVFLWLFVREMNAHEHTRDEYRRDLREIAGMRAEERLMEHLRTGEPPPPKS
jgi:hypothetical protein